MKYPKGIVEKWGWAESRIFVSRFYIQHPSYAYTLWMISKDCRVIRAKAGQLL
jgi:hypothetical protein